MAVQKQGEWDSRVTLESHPKFDSAASFSSLLHSIGATLA